MQYSTQLPPFDNKIYVNEYKFNLFHENIMIVKKSNQSSKVVARFICRSVYDCLKSEKYQLS